MRPTLGKHQERNGYLQEAKTKLPKENHVLVNQLSHLTHTEKRKTEQTKPAVKVTCKTHDTSVSTAKPQALKGRGVAAYMGNPVPHACPRW